MVVVWVILRRVPQGQWESQIVCGRQAAAMAWMTRATHDNPEYEWKMDRCPLL